MSDFTVRSDAVDVEQIMDQIRARIREKRGVDYTEAELQELATAKLQKFIDPSGLRSDLVEQFRKHHRPAEWPNYSFEENTLYESHRGVIRAMRRLLRPLLKLMFNPDPITAAFHVQSKLNTELLRQQERESLRYELVHNLVVELTRASVELQNLKMRVESLSSRLDFDERRARSLENVVQYRQPARRRNEPQAPAATAPAAAPTAAAPTAAPAAASGSAAATGATPGQPVSAGRDSAPGDREPGERRRRRRRRRRRPGGNMAGATSATGTTGTTGTVETADDGDGYDGEEADGRGDGGESREDQAPAHESGREPDEGGRAPEGDPGDRDQ
jgi:hypothetical protein